MSSDEMENSQFEGWFAQWEAVARRYDDLTSQLADPAILGQPSLVIARSKERADIEEVSQLFADYQAVRQDIASTERLLHDPHLDAEFRSLAADEADMLRDRCARMERQAQILLHPRNAEDDRNSFIEIRAGTGGDEAGLFAGELLRMYLRYAEKRGLRAQIIDASETGVGGIREAIALVEGTGAYAAFRYESGVHRVQRVPTTEANGRIHTSTATVAVMPEVEDVDVHLDPKDLRVDTFCSSGAGGQSVNTTYSAVRITHLPTGLVVTCQDERSQLKNREKAMRTLRTRIGDAEREKRVASIAEQRRSQVGAGSRSEKIRTYNYPQNRVTDHRIGLSLHKLDAVLDGELRELVNALDVVREPENCRAGITSGTRGQP
ncbi:MAG: peptide chain release factor 1 [Nitrospira sp.]|nr:peptide chain release factor 1 [Nitrospira sp.]